VVAILTEWDEFKDIKWQIKQFSPPYLIVDGRMIVEKKYIPKEINLITI
jgi:UDP-glucose 6-dehydrogenase